MTRAAITLSALVGLGWLGFLSGVWIGTQMADPPATEYVTDPAVCRMALMEQAVASRQVLR